MQGLKKFHVRVYLKDNEARGLTILFDQAMETIMLPVAYDKVDPNRVVPAEPQDSQLWKAVRSDSEIPESAKKSPATGG